MESHYSPPKPGIAIELLENNAARARSTGSVAFTLLRLIGRPRQGRRLRPGRVGDAYGRRLRTGRLGRERPELDGDYADGSRSQGCLACQLAISAWSAGRHQSQHRE